MTAISESHIVPLVRKLRDAGVPPPAAEAIGETMEQVITKAELRAELDAQETRLKLYIAESAKQSTLATLAIVGLGVAVIVLLLK